MKSAVKIVFVLFILSMAANAQDNSGLSIKGRVIDNDTKQPLSHATVFLANTTFGTFSGDNGEFQINNVPYGVYNIVFSFIGYETISKHFYSYQAQSFNFDIKLRPKSIQLKNIDVVAKTSGDWEKKLRVFKREFIGETDNADKTTILNPEVIDFTGSSTNDFQASSDSVIRVENKALGYMIYILLDKFQYKLKEGMRYFCYPRFEELHASTADEQKEWEENRRNCYLGSSRHFFLSLVKKKLEKESFRIYSAKIESNELGGKTIAHGDEIPDSSLTIESESDSTIFGFKHETFLNKNSFEIFWDGGDYRPSSVIYFSSDYTLIDRYGNILESGFSNTVFGHWATRRIADTLPTTYVYRK